MPATNPKPPTLRKAKRAHQKAGSRFEFTPSQFRAAERRAEQDDRAAKLRAKEQRAKVNKRRRDEKEDKEREAKRRLVAEGKVSVDALWGKVRASQARLNTFFGKPKAVLERTQHLEGVSEEERVADPERYDTLVNEMTKAVTAPEKMDEKELSEFFSTMPTTQNTVRPESPAEHTKLRGITTGQILQPAIAESEQDSFDQSLFESIWDFEIAEDNSAEPDLPQLTTPSSMKRKANEMEFTTPSKSARSALSEMSPSKVNVRAQEKPDITSAPPSQSKMLSPLRDWVNSSQIAADMLATISTQDLEEDEDFIAQKENNDPLHDGNVSKVISGDKQSVQRGEVQSRSVREGKRAKETGVDHGEFGDYDDLLGITMNTEDEFDDGLDDADLAAMSSQLPAKNTFVSDTGSPKKARPEPPDPQILSATKITGNPNLRTGVMPPPISKFADKIKKAMSSPSNQELLPSTQSFSLDEDLEADLLEMADQVDAAVPKAIEVRKPARVLPWLRGPFARLP